MITVVYIAFGLGVGLGAIFTFALWVILAVKSEEGPVLTPAKISEKQVNGYVYCTVSEVAPEEAAGMWSVITEKGAKQEKPELKLEIQ